MGIFNANNNVNIESNEKKRVLDMIKKHDTNYMSNEEVPMLFSNKTNWKGKPFMTMYDFVMRMNTEKPDFLNQAT